MTDLWRRNVQADEQDIPATMLLFPSNLSDSTSAYVVVHSAHRQPVPDGIYDYGGPLPSSESLLAREDNRRALTDLSQKLGWAKFGWTVPSSSNREPKSHKGSQSRNQAGFGWWEEAKWAQRQAVADGGMYI